MTRTSETHPIRVDILQSDRFAGRIGMTFCPGKKQPDAMTGAWDRNLPLDLKTIAALGATRLVSVIEQHELDQLSVSDMGQCVQDAELVWHHLPVIDTCAPAQPFEQAWESQGAELRRALTQGELIVIHCKGGLGRTGTLAAQLLMEFGEEVNSAIEQVRKVRHGAIETSVQENYLQNYKAP